MLWRWVEQASEKCFKYMWQMGEVGCAEVVGVVCSSMQRWVPLRSSQETQARQRRPQVPLVRFDLQRLFPYLQFFAFSAGIKCRYSRRNSNEPVGA
jgi:hypothetical protein